MDADLEAVACEIEALAPQANTVEQRQVPKRQPLPAQLPRREIRHEPESKYADHLPLYRQEGIFARAGLALPRSTLAQWVGSCGVQLQPLADAMWAELLTHPVLHSDETPVTMHDPGAGKTHQVYLWTYCSTGLQTDRLVVFDFAESRAGRHPAEFLGHPGEGA